MTRAFDEATGTHPPAYSTEAPPPQQLPTDLSLRLEQLKLGSKSPESQCSTVDECIAHLKLLEAIHQLREEAANRDGLFGISSPQSSESEEGAQKSLRVCEKRWAIYVNRAVDRFTRWYEACVPATVGSGPCGGKLTQDVLTTQEGIQDIAEAGQPIAMLMTKDRMPPLDVLMVWHAYLLNPRCFFEDCFRYGKMDFYATGLPWSAIDQCINKSLDYVPSDAAKDYFETATGCHWNNIDDPDSKTLDCPNCGNTFSSPWTKGAGYFADSESFQAGYGYADSSFACICPSCGVDFSHDFLRVQKFRKDVLDLMDHGTPLPGTVMNRDGLPEQSYWRGRRYQIACNFPSQLVLAGLYKELLTRTAPHIAITTMEDIRTTFERGMRDKDILKAAGTKYSVPTQGQRAAFRCMMSRYWYNSSPFALDLSGAVTRQGSFVEKMHNLDWLHSPALHSTMDRLIQKYTRFIHLMSLNADKTAVPTLDVDLAWHTHQLAPQSYYRYSKFKTRKLIAHDDKIEETKLSDAFAWTSKKYQDTYGEPYSACTCWYCEAIRESHTSAFDKVLHRKKAAATDNLHAADDVPDNPLKSPHISAHNAVRDADWTAKARVKHAQLDKDYQRACKRARKEGRREPVRNADYAYAYGYGTPMVYPMYYPYAVDPCMAGGGSVYVADPCFQSVGGYGACAAGTCGGGAAGGACGSGGGCGGGGGGGCGGGGGGGGGCGGGGGGGGC